jgi:hypothetical protein
VPAGHQVVKKASFSSAVERRMSTSRDRARLIRMRQPSDRQVRGKPNRRSARPWCRHLPTDAAKKPAAGFWQSLPPRRRPPVPCPTTRTDDCRSRRARSLYRRGVAPPQLRPHHRRCRPQPSERARPRQWRGRSSLPRSLVWWRS